MVFSKEDEEDEVSEENASRGLDEGPEADADDEVEEDLGSVAQEGVSCVILPFNDPLKSTAEADQVVDIVWCSVGNHIFIVSIVSRSILVRLFHAQLTKSQTEMTRFGLVLV